MLFLNKNNIIMSLPIHKLIGIKPQFLQKQVYAIQYCALSPSSHNHLIVNHGEDLILYNSQSKSILKHKNNHNSNSATDPIIKAVYSKKYQVIFLMRKSQQLEVYSDQLILLNKLVSVKGIRHSIDWIFVDKLNAFLVLTSECLKLVFVEISCNHLKSLFKTNYEFHCSQLNTYTLPPSYFLEFSNKILVFEPYILLASSSDVKMINFFNDPMILKSNQKTSLDQHYGEQDEQRIKAAKNTRTILHLTGICQFPEQITTLLYNEASNFLICATIYGKILFYKINFGNIMATVLPTTLKTKITVNHKLKSVENQERQHSLGHSKATSVVTVPHPQPLYQSNQLTVIPARQYCNFKLEVHNFKQVNYLNLYKPKILFTVGADDYLQVISLEHMACIQKLRLSSRVLQSDFMFVSHNQFIAVTNDEGFEKNLYSYQLCLDYKLKWNHQSTIIQSIYNHNDIVMVLTDNSLNWIDCNHQAKNPTGAKLRYRKFQKLPQKEEQIKQGEGLSKQQRKAQPPDEIVQAFVPKSCKTILCITKYPYLNDSKSQEYWLLTNDGEIHKYKISQNLKHDRHKERRLSVQIAQSESSSFTVRQFIDSYNHETNEKILQMCFIDIVPIFYDSDIKQKSYMPNFKHLSEVKPIIFGCYTGQILICPTYDPNDPQGTSCIKNVIMRIRNFTDPVVSISLARVYGGENPIHPNQNQQSSKSQLMTSGQLEESIRIQELSKERKEQFVGKCRIITYCSCHQIVVAAVSNYKSPHILYKTLIRSPNPLISSADFTIKSLGRNFIGITSSSLINILFAYFPDALCQETIVLDEYPPQLSLYSPISLNHEQKISAFEHCSDITFISGDASGKIGIWTMEGEVIATIQINQQVQIEMCYYFKNLGQAVFGYHGKIFDTPIRRGKTQSISSQKKQEDIDDDSFQRLMHNSQWMNQAVNVIKKGGRSGSENTAIKLLASILKGGLKDENINKKRTVQPNEGNQRHETKFLRTPSKKKYQKISKNSSNTSILPKIRQQTKPISDPAKVKSKRKANRSESLFEVTSINQKSSKEYMDKHENEKTKRIQDFVEKTQHNNKNKKNRNKSYEHLFHFPSLGLYQQLIYKDMLQQ